MFAYRLRKQKSNVHVKDSAAPTQIVSNLIRLFNGSLLQQSAIPKTTSILHPDTA